MATRKCMRRSRVPETVTIKNKRHVLKRRRRRRKQSDLKQKYRTLLRQQRQDLHQVLAGTGARFSPTVTAAGSMISGVTFSENCWRPFDGLWNSRRTPPRQARMSRNTTTQQSGEVPPKPWLLQFFRTVGKRQRRNW